MMRHQRLSTSVLAGQRGDSLLVIGRPPAAARRRMGRPYGDQRHHSISECWLPTTGGRSSSNMGAPVCGPLTLEDTQLLRQFTVSEPPCEGTPQGLAHPQEDTTNSKHSTSRKVQKPSLHFRHRLLLDRREKLPRADPWTQFLTSRSGKSVFFPSLSYRYMENMYRLYI